MVSRLLVQGKMRLILLCLVGACTAPLPEPDPLVLPPEPLPEWLNEPDGTYFTRTEVEVDVRLPATPLDAFADAPGATLFAVAEAAGASALATLRAELSEASAQQLEGWFDEVLASNALGRLGILGMAEGIRRLPPDVLVESELTLATGMAHHRLDAIYFDPDTLGDRSALGELASEIIEIDVTTTVAEDPWGDGSSSRPTSS